MHFNNLFHAFDCSTGYEICRKSVTLELKYNVFNITCSYLLQNHVYNLDILFLKPVNLNPIPPGLFKNESIGAIVKIR